MIPPPSTRSFYRKIQAKIKSVVPVVIFLYIFYVSAIYVIVKQTTQQDKEDSNTKRSIKKQSDHSDVSNSNIENEIETDDDEEIQNTKIVVFFLILCEDKDANLQGGKLASDVNRQIRQAAVMLKSAVALTSSTLRFIVIADSEELYKKLVNTTSLWPEEYKSKLLFEFKNVWYPSDRDDMRTMFRICATERLFIPKMFPEEDAGIYIDTDLIFLRPPEDLWKEFDKFNDKEIAAMSPCLFHYDTKRNKVPYYGKTGLNAGIMHMNLTRIKQFPHGGWITTNMRIFDNFKKKIKLADQDILNILFYQNPNLLHELDCAWNYRVWQCSQGTNLCPATSIEGANIIHGNALAFVNNEEMKLQVVFEAWEEYNLETPLNLLLTQMKTKLKNVSDKKLHSKCSQIPSIDVILTKQLEVYIFRMT